MVSVPREVGYASRCKFALLSARDAHLSRRSSPFITPALHPSGPSTLLPSFSPVSLSLWLFLPLPPLLFPISFESEREFLAKSSDRCLGDDAFVYRPRLNARPLTLLPCKRHARRAQLLGRARSFVLDAPRAPKYPICYLPRRLSFDFTASLENESDTL